MIKPKPIFLEIITLTLIFLACFLFDFFIFWQPNLQRDLTLHTHYYTVLSQLLAKQNRLQSEKNTTSQLQHWKNKDPDFYQTVSTVSHVNQQVALLTKLIQQAHFTIQQVTQMVPLKNSHSDCHTTFTSKGNFIDLFSLITTLTHFSIPFTLSQLAIDQQQYKMTFVLRGCDA